MENKLLTNSQAQLRDEFLAMNSCSLNVKNKKKFLSPPKTGQFSSHNHQNIQKPVVPIGPRFQAELPTFIGPSYKKLDTSRWLGTKVWPIKNTNLRKIMTFNGNKSPQERLNPIGKGRAATCSCHVPGSSQCVQMHVAKEKIKLKIELGAAFWEWKFGEMGEGSSQNWTANEKQKFDSILEMNFSKKNDWFLKNALKVLPNKKMDAIISYYFNIIVPRQISMEIKSGRNPVEITTDDEDTEETFSSGSRPKKRLKNESPSLKWKILDRRKMNKYE
ncbi:AT-rich interactive domain-containing protein 1-like [Primulina huaijiensis]|uniref:AT-rich interactive domain-containing protein 1-like n=1 Tax=Primulina huaijiensis TaxID=1492673 RepID=UPI003CC704A5